MEGNEETNGKSDKKIDWSREIKRKGKGKGNT
jgi:hypothetical protein